MKLTLIYEGPLRSTQNSKGTKYDKSLAEHKNDIRNEFDGQLKSFWEVHPFLSTHKSYPKDWGVECNTDEKGKAPLLDVVAAEHTEFARPFVPLVKSSWKLHCKLNIQLLRFGNPSLQISDGDIDNRLKTLIDALRMPQSNLEAQSLISDDKDPFYCLLEDDNLITEIGLKTDRLLKTRPTKSDADRSIVIAIIAVEIRPFESATMFNLSFVD